MGWPKGVEPLIPVPQTGVLPLNYGHHTSDILPYRYEFFNIGDLDKIK